MNPHTHDPREFVRGLQQILVSDSKRIGFLAGAGTSMVRERPTSMKNKLNQPIFDSLICGTIAMTEIIENLFKGVKGKEKFYKAIQAIKKELETEKQKFHIENLVSKISQKEIVVGAEKLCGLCKSEFKELKEHIEYKLKSLVASGASVPSPFLFIFTKSLWITCAYPICPDCIGDFYVTNAFLLK